MNMKATLQPVIFAETNERERQEYQEQLARIQEMYGGEAKILPTVELGQPMDPSADAILFPQLIFAAFRHDDWMKAQTLPMVVITSRFGTVEMWDWEIVTYIRDLGLTVFAPYTENLAKTILRAIAVKTKLKTARFLIFQDSPGEGMQAYIFKKFYWWEKQSTEKIEQTFGCKLIYRSYRAVCEKAKAISDDEARAVAADWNLPMEDVPESAFLKNVKSYIAIKREIAEIGGVDGVGANCLNESFHSDVTPCLAWNMLFERDGLIWACEGDTLSMISAYILYHSLKMPVMMTNLYPFLVGMAALAHEKIQKFPEIEDPDCHALGVHCGYFGFAPRSFCSCWTARPKVLEIVQPDSCAVDCCFPKGKATLAKIYPGFEKLSVIGAEIEDYVEYPGSDCRRGALIRYDNGHQVMDNLCSHHSLVISGDAKPELHQIARVFGFREVVL
ncbi:MAG: hypothetical protein PUD50_03470 [Eubacteriales bacterium]|nr:hypothetical protein [Eubacteriales bacterium]